MSPGFINRIGLVDKVEKSNAALTSFSNNTITVQGQISLDLRIGEVVLARHVFIVTNMLDVEFLVGLDFLEANKLSIDFGGSKLFKENGQYCTLLEKPRDIPHVKKIRCKDTVIIPPRTVQFISGKIPQTFVNYQGITEPYEKTMLASGVLITPSIVYTDKRWVPIKCINISNEPMTVYKGSMLGFLRPVKENGRVQGVKMVRSDLRANDSHHAPAGFHSVAGAKVSKWTKNELFDALKLQKIQVEMSESETQRLKDVLWQYRSCFAYDKDDFGCCNMFNAHIDLKRDSVPSWTPERRVPYNLEHKMDDLMDNMISTGVVEPLTTESNWNSPIFLVAKSSPGTYRVVADLRGVNKQCLADKYDLPNINHVLDKIGGDCIFSTFDMAASFHQIPYDEASKPITAFSYKGRRYNFARMIMGHCSSSSIFTRMVYRLLEHSPSIEHLLYFLDDLLLGSKDVHSHIERLERMLKQLMSANLKLTPNKTELMRTEVRYVGITLSTEGIRINDDRIEAIKKIEPPRTVKETQKVLGFFGYNRKFVRRYAELSEPLYELLQKGRKFIWTSECQKSFEDLKIAISSSPTLCFPEVHDPHDSYEVTVDASIHGLAATLTQMIDGQRRTVGYFSKAVPRHKREWGQTKLEFESLCASLKHWAVYLRGAKTFKVITDCKSLLHLDTIFKANPTMIRRLQELAAFNFTMHHIEGVRNVSDFLSRYGMKPSTVEISTQTEGAEMYRVKSITPICVDTSSAKENTSSPLCDGSRTQSEERKENILPPVCDDSTTISEVEIPSDLQLLFEGEHESAVDYKIIKDEDVKCYCALQEMPVNDMKFSNVEIEEVRVSAVAEDIEVDPKRKKICDEQDKDQILKVVKDWIIAGEKPKIQTNRTPSLLVSLWKQFNLLKISEDGLLMRTWLNVKHPDQKRDLIVVPENLVEGIMKLHHSTLTSCHPGAEISVDLCRRNFYWPKMVEDFKEYIAACEKCGAIKQPQRYLKAPLRHMLFHSFNDCIIVDHIVPESEGRTPRGYRYILTITDAWSNYVVAVPVRTQTAKENIEQIVRRWTLIHGIPKEIIVDNHPGYSADYFKAVWQYFECKVTHGTSYKARSTGKAERSNKRINQALRAAIPEGKERSWDIYLGYCVMALNSLKNRHTGYSSNRLVFGRETNTPITLLVDNDLKTEIPSKKSKGAYEMYTLMKRTLRKVRENADTDFLYSKHQHDRNILGPYFKAGDLCYVLINCPQHKYSIRWRGPLLVKKVINDHLYVVQITPDTDKVTNISKMKHFARNKHNRNKYALPVTHSGAQPALPITHSGAQTALPVTQSGAQTATSDTHAGELNNDDSDEDEQFATIHYPQRRKRQSSHPDRKLDPAIAAPDMSSTPVQPPSARTTTRDLERVTASPIAIRSTPPTESNGGDTNRQSGSLEEQGSGNSTSAFVSFETSDEGPDQLNDEQRTRLRSRHNLRPPDYYGRNTRI